MADKFLNLTDLVAIKNWIEGKFATILNFNDLEDRVETLEAAGGEPNVIETVKLNGTELAVDANKAVDVLAAEMKTQSGGVFMAQRNTSVMLKQKTQNDPSIFNITLEMGGQGSYAYDLATTDYVDENGGKIDHITVNGTEQTITNKTVALIIPTATSGLTNDSDFQTGTEVQTAIGNALADITGIDFQVVQTLPATGVKGTIYLVSNSGSGQNIYDEYIWLDGDPTGRYEKIGTTAVDLSNYWTMTSGQSNTLEAATVAEVQAILEPANP